MAHDVFISYSTPDRHVATAVCARLEAGGIRCWIAPRDILPGTGWGGAIVRAISETRVMVLIFSSKANQSPQILREVERAVGRGVVVVPVRIEDVAPEADLEYFLSSQHWLDVLTAPLEEHLDRICGVVRRVLDSSDDAHPGPAAIVQPATGDTSGRSGSNRRWLRRSGGIAAALVVGGAVAAVWLRGSEPALVGETDAEIEESVAEQDPLSSRPPASTEPTALKRTSDGVDPPADVTPVEARSAESPRAAREVEPAGDPARADAVQRPAEPSTGVAVVVLGEAREARQTEATILTSIMRDGDLRAMDAATLQLLRGDPVAIERAVAGDIGALASLASENAAKYIVVGDLIADAQPAIAGPFFTGTARLDVTLYDVDAGQVVRAESFAIGSGGVPGTFSPTSRAARTEAVDEVGDQAAAAIERWIRDEGG